MRESVSSVTVPLDALQSAHEAGLRYRSDHEPGIRRLGGPKRFRYTDAEGAPLRDPQVLERIRQLAVPPAWTDVWISPLPNGHLQATGRDARGRKQYRYHARWNEFRNETKFGRAVAFAEALPDLRRRIEADLQQRGLPRTKVLAAVMQLLQDTLIRIGNPEYARDNDSYGLTTLRDKHVQIDGSTLRFRFRGKSGKQHEIDLRDRRLARIVKSCKELPGRELFQFVDDSGSVQSVGSGDVNDYLRQVTGQDLSAKDFRTWGGTVLAASVLYELGGCETEKAIKAQIVRCIQRVSGKLGNTVAICRKYYVHPAILEAYAEGHLLETMREHLSRSGEPPGGWSRVEAAVLELLRQRQGGARDASELALPASAGRGV
jgi:DNA topoisomerase-1